MRRKKAGRPWWIRRAAIVLAAVPLMWITCLLALRWIDPPFTGVQIQRRLESWFSARPYVKRYEPVALSRISRHLQHAVIAAEDGRFHQHFGIDWKELQAASSVSTEGITLKRGASTITQQLVKNLFFTTHRNPIRKAAEFFLAPAAELLLGKERILELYLNSVEWGPGVFGAEAAAKYHYRQTAAALNREQAARLAACLPAPRVRQPARMHQYSQLIIGRMEQMGW